MMSEGPRDNGPEERLQLRQFLASCDQATATLRRQFNKIKAMKLHAQELHYAPPDARRRLMLLRERIDHLGLLS